MESPLKHIGTVCALLASMAILPFPAQAADLLETLQRLYRQGDAQGAYELATRARGPHEGDPDFDFYYGLAAIDSGHASEGVFALERVLLAFPEDDRARLELGRGYFLLQEYSRAKREFLIVLDHDPPATVKTNIQQYLDAIRLRETRFLTTSTAYVELGFGYDTNVNSAPPDADFLVPSLPGFQARLDPLATEQADWFGQIAAGGQVVTPYAPGRSLYFGGDINQRLNVDQSEFDTGWVTGRTGWNGLFGKNRFRAGLQAQYFQLDYDEYRNLFGINGDWRHSLNAKNELIGFVSADVLRYPSQSIRNSTLYNLGGAWKRLFEAKYRPELLVSLYGGYENPDSSTESAQAIAQRNIVGARVTGRFIPTGRLSVYGSGGYQRSHYIGTDILFQTQRTDNFYSLEAGFTYLLARHWSLRGDLYYYDNQSNIFLNDYDRTWGLLRVRYNWF
jgi:tetratricopeptide (TPR) repeat protein